jgi:hypothetical protein
LDIDIRPLAYWANRQGWTIVVDARGARFFSPEGVYIVTYPHHPAHPIRRLADVRTALKTAGLPIPTLGPSARRPQRRTG